MKFMDSFGFSLIAFGLTFVVLWKPCGRLVEYNCKRAKRYELAARWPFLREVARWDGTWKAL